MKRLKGGLTRREFVTGVAATGLMAITPLGRAGQPGARADGQPNIVFIMADDMGYADAGCYGARHIRTPHIDSLAAAGVPGFRMMLNYAEKIAPLRQPITQEDVGNVAAFLASDSGKMITGETIYIDGGYHILGLTLSEEDLE